MPEGHLFDTVACSRWRRGDAALRRKVGALPPDAALYTCGISVGELTLEILKTPQEYKERLRQRTQEMLVHFQAVISVLGSQGSLCVLLLFLLCAPLSGAIAETISAVSPPVKLTLPAVERPLATGRRNERAIAVLIGNRDYSKPGIPQVLFAFRDVQAVQDHLVRVLGYQQKNIIYRENATLADLNAIFGRPQNPRGELARRTEGGNYDVFVYYSGHGAPAQRSSRGFLVPVDGNPDNIANTGYPLDTLDEHLSRLRARKLIVVLDTCFSGDSAGGSLFPGTSGVRWEVKNPLLALDNAFVLTASSGTEVANWYHEKRHGLFTYWFLLGLQMLGHEPGSPAPTADGFREFLTSRVTETTQRLGRSQTPEVVGPPGKPMLP